jgi:hypothetical protein
MLCNEGIYALKDLPFIGYDFEGLVYPVDSCVNLETPKGV